MAEQVVIEFVSNTEGLQKATTEVENLTAADEKMGVQFKKTSDSINQGIEKNIGSAGELSAGFKQIDNSLRFEAFKQAAANLKAMGDEAEKTVTKSQRLTTQLRELRNQLSVLEEAGKRGTKQFIDLAVKAGKLEDQIGDTGKRVRVLASDTKNLDAALSLASGLAGGFAVAQGAAALFGKENEDLQKALLKVQAALALLNGLQAVAATINKDSAASVVVNDLVTKLYNKTLQGTAISLNTFKIALAATGIGLAIIGISALVANWDTLKEKIFGTSKELEAYNTINEKSLDNIAKETVSVNELFRRARDLTLTTRERKQAIQELQTEYPVFLKNLNSENVLTEKGIELQKKLVEAIALKAKIQAATDLLVEQEKENIKLQEEGVAKSASIVTGALAVIGQAFGITSLTIAASNKAQKDFNAAQEKGADSSKVFTDIISDLNAQMDDLGGDPNAKVPKATKALKDFQGISNDIIQSLFKVGQGQTETAAGFDALQKAIQAQLLKFSEGLGFSAQTYDDYTKSLISNNAEILKSLKELGQGQTETDDKTIQQKQQLLDTSIVFANQLFSFESALNAQKQANLNNQLKDGLISEKKYATEVAKLKRKQAIADKEQAAFNVVVNTAVAISKVAAQTGVLAVILSLAIGALGAAQLATVLAQPIPQFAKGTRKAPPGFKMVGEQGPELIYDGGGYPIIPNGDTEKIMASWIPELPYISDSTMSRMERASGNIDYDLLAEKIGEKLKQIPVTENHWDASGFHKAVRTGFSRVEYETKRYNW